jgi:hypothetical protein
MARFLASQYRAGYLADMSSGSRIAKRSRPAAISAPTAAKQLTGFIRKFDPHIARLIREVRAALRKRLPTAVEQVYDNYSFLAIGFCSTERTSDCVVSIAASAKSVALSFYYGASLPDPGKILQGSGKQNRYLRIEIAAMLATPAVEALLCAAITQAKAPLALKRRGYTMIKSVSSKQRPRRLN